MILNTRIISVAYLAPTNTRGSRVKIQCPRRKESITLDYDYECDSVLQQGIKYLESKGFTIIGTNSDYSKKKYLIMITDFELSILHGKPLNNY